MKKALLLLFGVIVGLPAISQTQLGEISKLWKTKKVSVVDGSVYRYRLWDGSDTAIYYQTGIDTFEVTTTFKKVTSVKPPVLPDIITTIDDNVITLAQAYNPATNAGDNIYIPTTGWSHFKGQPWNEPHNNKTYSFADLTGAYVEVTCTCYKIEWWTEKRENHGIVAVQKMKQQTVNGVISWVADGVPVDVDLYDARTDNNSLLVWTSPAGMPNATNKFRFLYTGRKNAAATSPNIGHDKFITFTKQ